MFTRKTLKREVEIEGFGIHTGKFSKVKINSALNDGGKIVFLTKGERIEASYRNVVDLKRATTIGVNDKKIKTVEHMLSALYGLGVTDAVIEVVGEEIPVLDGSSKEFVEEVMKAGFEDFGKEAKVVKVVKPFRYENSDGAFIEVRPIDTEELVLKCSISYDYPSLRWQDLEIVFGRDTYINEIAPARTFCFYEEIAHLLRSGLGRGGNYRNVVVIGPKGIINGPPRFPDEPVRHKILDLIGDLSLLGAFLIGELLAHKNNHRLHVEFIKSFMESDCYKYL
ncbi:MAG: UDP-3-O-acyl-N-acetylglucosamine deacetylase [Thermosulfidibacteraceae bacterium]|jgi:UDP-3-O-acyl N-acetylglucosamine deacetylase